MSSSVVHTVECTSGEQGLPLLLDAVGLCARIPPDRPVLIKPNLVECLPPPITTPVDLVEALVRFLRSRVDNPVIIGEGTGSMQYDTWHPFRELGYADLAREAGIELVDLNTAPCQVIRRPEIRRRPEMHLPRIALESFLISVPVLKAHTLAGVTLGLKNMMGLLPPSIYSAGGWGKSSFHADVQGSVADLNRYRAPDFVLLDARLGMPEAHLWGPVCDPPVGLLTAGADPVAVDAHGAGLLGKDWKSIEHISELDGELGRARAVVQAVPLP